MATIDGAFSGFLEYNTNQYLGFTDQNITDFTRMIQYLRGSRRYADVLAFFRDLETHLYGPGTAHSLPVEEWVRPILDRLYYFYRNSGFTGDTADMLKAIEKNVVIATEEDVENPVSASKAIDLQAFGRVIARHQESLYSHPQLTKLFRPARELQLADPGLYFSSALPDSYSLLAGSDGVPIERWDVYEGTVVFHLKYTSDDAVDVPLFTFHYDDCNLQVRYQYGPEVNSSVRFYKNDVVIASLKTAFNQSGADILSITWSDAFLGIRNSTATASGSNVFPRRVPKAVTLDVPLGHGNISIQEWVYYPQYTSPNAQTFFFI